MSITQFPSRLIDRQSRADRGRHRSSIRCTLRAPADRAASSTARRSTVVMALDTQISASRVRETTEA